MDWFLYDIGLRHERVKYLKGKLFDANNTENLNSFLLPHFFMSLKCDCSMVYSQR